jgi:hypothetical protein
MIMGSFRLREPGDRDYAKRRRQMTRQINTFTTRAQHNGDLGYFVLDYLAHSFPTQLTGTMV